MAAILDLQFQAFTMKGQGMAACNASVESIFDADFSSVFTFMYFEDNTLL